MCRQDERRFRLRVRTGNSPQAETAPEPHDVHGAAAGRAGEGVRTHAVPRHLHAGGTGAAHQADGGQDTGVVQQPQGSAPQATVQQLRELRVDGPVNVLPGVFRLLHAAGPSLRVHIDPE